MRRKTKAQRWSVPCAAGNSISVYESVGGTENNQKSQRKANINSSQSVNLQVWGCGSVSPFVDLLCDHSAAQRAALLPVKPQSDALVTEDVLHHRKPSRQLTLTREEHHSENVWIHLTQKSLWVSEVPLTDGAHVSSFTALIPGGRWACMLTHNRNSLVFIAACSLWTSQDGAAEHWPLPSGGSPQFSEEMSTDCRTPGARKRGKKVWTLMQTPITLGSESNHLHDEVEQC